MNTYCRIAVLAALIISLSAIRTEAQNVQLHYDFGRGCATSTVEISRELCFWQGTELELSANFVDKGFYMFVNPVYGNFRKLIHTMHILATHFILKYIFINQIPKFTHYEKSIYSYSCISSSAHFMRKV